MIKKKLLIYSAFIFMFIIQNLSANEIISRYLYNVGDQVRYKIDRILPNKSTYITESNLINIIEFITIASAGDGTDFGDCTTTRNYPSGLSNGHGGLS